MKSIQTLIKVNKQALDEKRRELAELDKQKTEMLQWQRAMEDDLKKEREFAANNPEMSMTFDSYRKKINKHQLNIQVALTDLDRQIAIMSTQITELFGEVKKYEIVEQQKIAHMLKEQKARETKMLDEVAMNNYLKEQAENN